MSLMTWFFLIVSLPAAALVEHEVKLTRGHRDYRVRTSVGKSSPCPPDGIGLSTLIRSA